ncbi:hypothetical protein [Sutcliffiella halmapala]|uniref:hypothetical protein n=1 Tax=Sutcliffiella halmapala TaxID=79882 RepID=UPI000995AFF2|nr:hypothetical protein [Sutcliffiella halmapala]
MKKYYLMFLSLITVIGLAACNTDVDQDEKIEVEAIEVTEVPETNAPGEEEAEPEDNAEESDSSYIEDLTIEEIKEGISFEGLGEDDELKDLTFENGEINAVIKLEDQDLFAPKDFAVTRYSSVSDYLLTLEGWETLTVEFEGIGEISIDISEKETNEVGSYFPIAEIEESLNLY